MANWPTVSLAIRMRMRQLGISQADLLVRSQLSKQIAYELIHGKTVRDRSPRTLAAISEALEWHRDHLEFLLQGRIPPEPVTTLTTSDELSDEILARLDRIERNLVEIVRKIDAIGVVVK